ncbi:MAG: RNA polymerase subunit sigma [Gemmatimonadetes bacterium HGW-Gemmatimonadetes-1]|nr:MAG: RNA polymerase subunit sigma [Gemmatimonadetes bacterium HGW-Gemmatimonadetes-1]
MISFDSRLDPAGRRPGRGVERRNRGVRVTSKVRGKRRSLRPAQIARAVDEGRESLDLYLDEISRVPLLNRQEEMDLARKAFQGDVIAQEKLARHNVRFVVSVAKKFQNRGVPLVDLIGEGNLGLMTAARKFDPDRGVKFISYAVWWIRQAVQAAIARHGRPVRVPLNRTADLSRLGKTTTLLKERMGRMPTVSELARATSLTEEAVRSLSSLNTEAVRLDHPTREGDGNERMERFALAEQEGTDANTMANSQSSDIEDALDSLPPRDAKVLRLYFGLDDGQPRTLEEIGRMMGVTRERIRQLRDRALIRLREGETGEKLKDLVA